MGAGNKLDPTRLEVADIFQTSVCPLAKVMRKELRSRGIDSLKVVYSKEEALRPASDDDLSCKVHCVCPPGAKRNCSIRRQVPGSVSFVPPVAGFILAGEVIRDLIAGGDEAERDASQ
jgi:tRNA A37 threonylcarbamoyladenosine dehydratase